MTTEETDGRRLRGERSRAHILDHAIAIASIDGLSGLTIGRVATEAGVSKGNITVLFGDKEALQIATLDRVMEQFRSAVVVPASTRRTPLDRLLAWVDNWFAFVEQRVLPGGCFLNSASSEYRARPGQIRDAINHYRHAGQARLQEWLEAARQAGQLRDETDVPALAFALLAFQASANVASLMGDTAQFKLAHNQSRRLLLEHGHSRPRSARRKVAATR
ncbi:TetR family transcriptional regulator [Bordetella genomosp. 10]|uniref:TetR family transcriptional regulator n=1 Tax=Bordetella genomosp. 10 TaxID=1416804 RepID=A0A261SCX9_9BORD|nr:TetR/AcrR family transcriptional regulator [Bordetella genomosp. 10]OZI34660.1 TetR family transcriptional regulator [Bordetella genomosp. 10]